MSKIKNKWWEKRVLRSVDNLKLWDKNPRFDVSRKPVTVRDYVEELISDSNDKQNFIALMESIAHRGFISIDPVIVWQDQQTKKFIVAEGNRRVMALKLLRSPDKSPSSIRKIVVPFSRIIDRDEYEKISVCVAPSYEDARWYILQRHSVASNQVMWQRLHQQRYIIDVYDSVNQDINKTVKETGFKRAAIIEALRYVKIRDIANHEEVTKYLSPEERMQVSSNVISMTVLERWFGNSQVREAWHIDFNENGVTINADLNSFYIAYARLLKLMLNKDNELGYLVQTRTIDSKFQEIFDSLPKVLPVQNQVELVVPRETSPVIDKDSEKLGTKKKPKEALQSQLKGNPKRRQLTDAYHEIATKSYKLTALFEELQKLPIYNYPNVAAASIRIFLDLAVDDYINSNQLSKEMATRGKKGYHDIILSKKLSILRGEFIDDRDANKIIDQLLHPSNDHSLNTLNEYIHGNKVHKVEPQFLNRFWDMLSPLFSVLINFKEV